MGSTISLTRIPSQERLERLAMLGEWYLHLGRKEQAMRYFKTVEQWRPGSHLADGMPPEGAERKESPSL
jgi:hypothetical protein